MSILVTQFLFTRYLIDTPCVISRTRQCVRPNRRRYRLRLNVTGVRNLKALLLPLLLVFDIEKAFDAVKYKQNCTAILSESILDHFGMIGYGKGNICIIIELFLY